MKGLFVTVLVFVSLAGFAAERPAAQKSSGNGVTVSIRPGDLSATAQSWDFAISLDTHSQELSDDLVRSAVLIDDKGREHRPLAWDGAKAGGHHRQGTLRFAPLAPRPSSLELRIARPGESSPRVFRWILP